MSHGATRAGTLFLVATPIGNAADLTPRARAVLAEVGFVLAEDTRRTASLLQQIGVSQRLVSCHEHNERERIASVVQALLRGVDVALVSDGGSPGISDPGFPLVAAAVAAGAAISAVPGPCAALLALQCSGLPTDRFAFLGFAPKKSAKRREWLRSALTGAASPSGSAIVYVPARDAAALLDDVAAVAGPDRPVAVARELTKVHEEVLRGTAASLSAAIRDRQEGVAGDAVFLGEVTVVIGPPVESPQPGAALSDALLSDALAGAMARGLTPNEALHAVRGATGVPRDRLYSLLRARSAALRSGE